MKKTVLLPLDTCSEMATTRDTGCALVEALEPIGELRGRTFTLGGGEKCRVTYRALRQRDRKLIQRFFRIANLTPVR